MVIELITVGTEILLGNIVNTNAQFLAQKCASLGYSVFYQSTVGDNEERLSQQLTIALDRSDIVILSGGLGPTEDDLTKETVAKRSEEHTSELQSRFDLVCRLLLEKKKKKVKAKNI